MTSQREPDRLPANDEPQAAAGGDGATDGGGVEGEVSPPPDEEPVGYKRPPKQHQFRPGQSGNPRGRPRGARGLKRILQKEFSQRMKIMEGDKPLKVSKLQLIVKRELEKAMAGNQRAIEHVISLNIQMFGLGPEEPKEEVELTIGEQIYLEAIMKRLAPAGDEEAGHDGDPSAAQGRATEDDDELE